MQPAARDSGERSDFADDCGDAGRAQTFFHSPQDLAVTRCPDHHDVLGIEPVRGEAEPVNVGVRQTPQHHAVPRRAPVGRKPSEDADGKGGSQRAILLVATRSEYLVQGPSREPAARQRLIDRGNAERQYPMDRRCRPLDPPDALAQLGKKGSFLDHVLFLFFISFLVNAGVEPAPRTAASYNKSCADN